LSPERGVKYGRECRFAESGLPASRMVFLAKTLPASFSVHSLKRIGFKVPAGVLLFIGVAAVLLLFWNHRRVGRVLDSYRGVPVYDNGLLFFRGYGKNYSAGGYYFGQKWQCVEFIKRFFYQAKGHQMPEVMGHAKSFFDESLPDGAFNSRRGLVQYRNGSTNKPCADDLIVFSDTKFGHVAIVTGVAGDSLEVIQQNIVSGTRQRFSLVASNGHYFVTNPRRPAGWLRKISNGNFDHR
jgi:surface antigen